jgi:NTP pyrophosphatase (non-canonical NTP hydrolase)
MLRKYFPSSSEGAALYGGNMESNIMFCRAFEKRDTFKDTILPINEFLESNGYDKVESEEFDAEGIYRDYPVFILPSEESNHLIVYLEKDPEATTQIGFLTSELTKFRDERDWEQFHNPKDLSIALSIEANELLEQYLWKKPEEGNMEKIEKELADVFAYALLLADKLKLDVEEILLRKIKHNGEKYPVEKAKGTATKYNEL